MQTEAHSPAMTGANFGHRRRLRGSLSTRHVGKYPYNLSVGGTARHPCGEAILGNQIAYRLAHSEKKFSHKSCAAGGLEAC